MSDSSQVIVDIDVGQGEARRVAENVRSWLVSQGIIQPNPSDCILGEASGYAPGPRYGAAVGLGNPDDYFLSLSTNGLRIQVGRRVFHAGGNGIHLSCAGCGLDFEPGTEWFDAVSTWFEGEDNVAFTCPGCHRSQRLAEWRGPWPWGFGHLGLEFWNWPPLSDAFVRAVGQHLQHRTILVRSRL